MCNQKCANKKSFVSPTTPGLLIYFRDYIIELVCLNVQPKLGPRFWKDKKYWGPKYRREIKGVYNLNKELDFSDPIVRTSLTTIIKQNNIKALVSKKTMANVVEATKREQQKIINSHVRIANKQVPVITDLEQYNRRNAKIVDIGTKNKITKLMELESGKNKKIQSD